MPLNSTIPEPWLSFLTEIDQSLDGEISLHCFGGFAIDYLFGLPRSTADIDVISGVVRSYYPLLFDLAGKDSELHKKHRVYLDLVGAVAVVPEDYETRLTEITPMSFSHMRIFVMELHDIVLSKISRDFPQDRSDVVYLAKAAKLDTVILSERYERDLRPYIIGRTSYVDQTLKLWIEMIKESRN